MSWVTVIWSMVAATSLTLGMVHVLVWWQNPEKSERLLFSLMTIATAWMALGELAMMKAPGPEVFATALRWYHVPVWLNMLALIGFVFVRLRAGRRGLAGLAVGLRSLTLVVNFAVPPNVNFREITGLRLVPLLGDWVALPVGRPNPWMAVAQLALLVLIAFLIEASITVWRRGEKRQAVLTGGSMVFFVTMGTLQAILGFWHLVDIPGGGSLYFLGMIVTMAFDLSLETKRAANLEVELRDTQERKRQQVAHLGRVATFGEISVSLAHEMNQPLGIILSNAQAAQRLLAKEAPDLGEVREILGDIVREDLRASEVIQRMRALLRRGEVSRQRLDLNEVAGEVFHLLRHELARREVVLSHDLREGLPAVSADRVQLQQVLLNLLLNACEAMEADAPETRRLHVATAGEGRTVSLAVTDAGRGLPAEVEQIFEPFYTRKEQGLGMGLAICRSIVTAHHGQLWAEPGEKGGAIFHVVLPIAEGAA
jgi:signal transduction histidine kinase